MKENNILIVGANFTNKGAQSMLFVTVNEIKKRVSNPQIFFTSTEEFDKDIYVFKEIYNSYESMKIALGSSMALEIKCFVKDIIKYVLGRRKNLFRFMELKRTIKKIDLIIDISGFNLGSKWEILTQEAYLNNIRLAKKNNIPMVMMPQSFGDFNYSDDKLYLLDKIEELLKYPKIIFAREKEGYQMLLDNFSLNNVFLSSDIVLQNSGIDIHNIYNIIPTMNLPKVKHNAVAIVPNNQCFNHGDKDTNLKIYREIINHLIDLGKVVYVFRHSKEDLEICKMIVEYVNNSEVTLLTNDFSCLEYDEFIKRFDFVICSRFHGAVHAYRNFIPCILLGWAIKYMELANKVGQKKFAFDITSPDFKVEKVISVVDILCNNPVEESLIIKEKVKDIQKSNCFDQIEEWMK